jgi:hypothetical protein
MPCAAMPRATPPGSGRPDGPPSRAAARRAMILGAAARAPSGGGEARAAAMGSGAAAWMIATIGAFWPRRMLPQGPGVKRINRSAPASASAPSGKASGNGGWPGDQGVIRHSGQKAGRCGAAASISDGRARQGWSVTCLFQPASAARPGRPGSRAKARIFWGGLVFGGSAKNMVSAFNLD